jgi:hypothetical protein
MVGQLGLTDDARLLLEFDDESHVIPLAVLRAWSERFAVQVGWSISRLEDDVRASARMNLFRSDGHDSWGRSDFTWRARLFLSMLAESTTRFVTPMAMSARCSQKPSRPAS